MRPIPESADNSAFDLRHSLKISAAFVALLWLIELIEQLFDLPLYRLGVNPGELSGLIGVALAPLIHGDIEHIARNSVSVLLLGTVFLYGYPKASYRALPIIWLSAGLGVWLFARPTFHFGASGLTHGLFFFVLLAGILRRDKRSIALLMIAFFMYGGMLMSIFPREQGISFESHLFGGFGGAIGALLFYHLDPKPMRKRYAWEGEDDIEQEAEDDPQADSEHKSIEDSKLH